MAVDVAVSSQLEGLDFDENGRAAGIGFTCFNPRLGHVMISSLRKVGVFDFELLRFVQ